MLPIEDVRTSAQARRWREALGGAVAASLAATAVALALDKLLEIADNGPGIPEAVLARIFEPYFSASRPDATSAASTGLGLAIASIFVVANGGIITAVNRSDGNGAVFEIVLLRDDTADDTSLQPDRQSPRLSDLGQRAIED